MRIMVRPANFDQDRELLIDALFRHLTPLSTPSRFEWLYKSNPHGQARAWIAIDTDRNDVIGVAAAFPRRMYQGSNEILAWVLGDFCVSEQYRSLGPALQLQRACLAAVEVEEVACCYDLPSRSMMAVYKRLGVSASFQMLRLAKPLRADRKIRERIGLPLAAQLLSLFGNSLLSFYNRGRKVDHSLTVDLHEGKCGDEFSALARSIGGRQGVCIARSAEYLNWRYVNNPLCRYELLTARRHDALLGYAVFLSEGEDALLVDLFGAGEEAIAQALIMRVVALLSARKIQTINIPLIESHPWRTLFEQLGFKIRETNPIIFYAPSGLKAESDIVKKHPWLLMHGDRDS